MSKTADVNGRPYARLSELMPGDMIELDDGFTCHAAGIVEVKEDRPMQLYFDCVDDDGNPQKPFLEGQTDDDCEHLIGIYPARGD